MAREIPPISTGNSPSAIKPISDVNTPTSQAAASAAQDSAELTALQQKLGSGVQYALVKSMEGTDQTTGGHLYLLELTNKQTLTVNSNVELMPGQMVAFQVNQSQLRLVAAVAATENQLIDQLIHQLSGQQDSGVSSFALLQALTETPHASPQLSELLKLSPPIAKAAAAIAQQIPELADLTDAKTLKNSLANSGLFFENKLSTGDVEQTLNSDLKALMTKINAEFKTNPALEKKLSESASLKLTNTAGALDKLSVTSRLATISEADPLEPISTYARVAAASVTRRA
ncbi:MAG TPA: hypothetical protein VFM46_13740, partial [Pseudomonadales bacterium]|nr:hypothetical protein [Pseudomonadales bacterium]